MSDVENPQEQWSAVEKLIDRWLRERQGLILLYCAVEGLEELAHKQTPTDIKIRAFCQALIDYVSAGHFAVYGELIQEAACFNDNHQTLIDNTLPKIESSTEFAIYFNDQYASEKLEDQVPPSLIQDLSKLGEHFVERFDLEDRLIEALHNSHREQVA